MLNAINSQKRKCARSWYQCKNEFPQREKSVQNEGTTVKASPKEEKECDMKVLNCVQRCK